MALPPAAISRRPVAKGKLRRSCKASQTFASFATSGMLANLAGSRKGGGVSQSRKAFLQDSRMSLAMRTILPASTESLSFSTWQERQCRPTKTPARCTTCARPSRASWSSPRRPAQSAKLRNITPKTETEAMRKSRIFLSSRSKPPEARISCRIIWASSWDQHSALEVSTFSASSRPPPAASSSCKCCRAPVEKAEMASTLASWASLTS
mmetsp:Transcript_99696/g.321428  ORF Transcript_99696/g.321428 Transcript_99696/m.321428 type:complete len:209 (+) Transcript_99696:266-892(+)